MNLYVRPLLLFRIGSAVCNTIEVKVFSCHVVVDDVCSTTPPPFIFFVCFVASDFCSALTLDIFAAENNGIKATRQPLRCSINFSKKTKRLSKKISFPLSVETLDFNF